MTSETTECKWAPDKFCGDIWESDCGGTLMLNDGPPSDNQMKFCCFCGKPIKEPT